MANYHISKDGTPGICKAEKGKCPLGANQPHFPDRLSAEEFSDNVNEIRASGEFTPDDKIKSAGISLARAELYVMREELKELEKNPDSEDSWKLEHLPDSIAIRQEQVDKYEENNRKLGHTREELKEKFARKSKNIKRYEDGSRIPDFVTRGDSSVELEQMGGAELVGRELSKAVDELDSVYELMDIKFYKNKPTTVFLQDKETGEKKVYSYTRMLDRGRTSSYRALNESSRNQPDKMSVAIRDKMTGLAKDELSKVESSGVDRDYIPSDSIMDSIKTQKGFYRSPAGSQATVKNAVKEMKSKNIKYDVSGSSTEGYTWTLTGDDGEVKTVKTEPFWHKV